MAQESSDRFAMPPSDLIIRAGATPGADVAAEYVVGAAGMKDMLMSLLEQNGGPASPGAPKVLDFGCGAGNVIRHFHAEAESGEVWGCDIDERSIDWLRSNLTPPFNFQALSSRPALALPSDHFDLVYAISVFTHLADDWAAWLLELRRVLGPTGILVLTFLGEGMAEAERAAPWDEDRVGMNVLRHGQDWEGGGPTVFLSDWWIRAHWGRAFEILDIHHDRDEHGEVVPHTHGYVLARKRQGSFTSEQLTALEPDEPRETAALVRNIEQLHADDRELRDLLVEAVRRGDTEHEWRVAAQQRVAELENLRARGPAARLARLVQRRLAARSSRTPL
ncbi:MAG TPA: class I SAM-dependent methyltransferase [Solirubrobacteraceae bacterium]|nr:class I SAM-dependent methyltransferase [Solirubrobacteraceae bacterium]